MQRSAEARQATNALTRYACLVTLPSRQQRQAPTPHSLMADTGSVTGSVDRFSLAGKLDDSCCIDMHLVAIKMRRWTSSNERG